jgi:hypothetical protein
MRHATAPRALCFAGLAAALAAIMAACLGNQVAWICLNPVTGKQDDTYDSTHYVNGMSTRTRAARRVWNDTYDSMSPPGSEGPTISGIAGPQVPTR